MLFMPAEIKPKSFESRRILLIFFLHGVDASRVYMRAWALGCFHSLSTNLSEGADRVGGQLGGDEECPFSGVTKSGRVWRKVPESDAWSEGGLVPLARAATSFFFFLSSRQTRANTSFVATKECLPRQKIN